jgi:hypothetical protein
MMPNFGRAPGGSGVIPSPVHRNAEGFGLRPREMLPAEGQRDDPSNAATRHGRCLGSLPATPRDRTSFDGARAVGNASMPDRHVAHASPSVLVTLASSICIIPGAVRIGILGWGSLLWEGGAEFDQWHHPAVRRSHSQARVLADFPKPPWRLDSGHRRGACSICIFAKGQLQPTSAG